MPYLLGHVSVLVQQTPWLVSAKVVVFFKIVHKDSMLTIICLSRFISTYGTVKVVIVCCEFECPNLFLKGDLKGGLLLLLL